MSTINDDNARKAKGRAMARVARAANPEWVARMKELIELVARTTAEFTTDNVFDLLGDHEPSTHEKRALGPIMVKAAKGGLCVKKDCMPRPSNRESRHNAPLTVWTSRVYEGAQP